MGAEFKRNPLLTFRRLILGKLTKAQREFLQRLKDWGPGPADPGFKPAQAALKAGYVACEVRRNKMRLHVFTITPAGLEALQVQDPTP
jgi:hypothetical protein